MSVHPKGKKWVVRWRDQATGRNRSEVWPTKKIADAHNRKIQDAKAQGEFAHLAKGDVRLRAFADDEWMTWLDAENSRDGTRLHVTAKTARDYKGWWRREIEPRIGGLSLKEVTPEIIEFWQMDMADDGVPQSTAWNARKVLDSILTRATRRRHIQYHPGAHVPKPKRGKPSPVRPWTPVKVEAVRAALLREEKIMWATFVSVMAYAALRPGEAWTLKWSDIGANVISFRASKTGRARSIPINKYLARDLLRWRAASDRSADDDPVFYGERTGSMMLEGSKNYWYAKTWPDALKAAEVERIRPYVLRHSAVSLWIAERHMRAEVARRAGHTERTMSETYEHIFAEYETSEKQDMEKLIREAREQWTEAGVPKTFPGRHLRVVGE